MTRLRRLVCAGVVCGCLAARPALAQEPEAEQASSSLELWGSVAASVVFSDPANPEYAGSFRRAGGFGQLGLAYRSRYFIDPYLTGGYALLASGHASLPGGPWGAGGKLDQQLDMGLLALGITSDLWRFRPRLGLGLALVVQSFDYRGHDSSSTQYALANQLGLGFEAVRARRFRLDVEGEVVVAAGADLTIATLGVVARCDLFDFR